MVEPLKNNPAFKARRGPVVLLIMDGVGFGKYREGDAVAAAHTETLDELYRSCPWTKLQAHGTAVGLPSDDDMGNSEVGHNAIGCGRVFAQGAKMVNKSLENGNLFSGETWKNLTSKVQASDGTMHFIGLLSDGYVHSHIDHLKALITRAKEDGVNRVRVHALLDGRDVGETSALDYFDPFENFLESLSDDSFDARIASGGGRMVITMDRYHANWDMVRKGWETHVLGEGRMFPNAHDAIVTLREETGAIDQDIPPFVIAEDGKPVGAMADGDSVVLFNFRGDRALEITKAFEEGDDFSHFDRKRIPDLEYAGMMEYDGDLKIPKKYLVSPPAIDRTVTEFLVASGVKQFSISETQKFGHVTYFFNGNRTDKFSEKLETYMEIPSDSLPFEQRPWMKCAEITDKVLETIESGEYQFIKLNFPNGDMVGHTGNYQAVICSMEALDLCIGRIKKAVEKAGGIIVLSADHGNSDDMFEHDRKTGAVTMRPDGKPKAKTAHSLNPVPCIIYDPGSAAPASGKGTSSRNGTPSGKGTPSKNGTPSLTESAEYEPKLREGLGISSLAATCIELLGFISPQDYDPSVLIMKNSARS